MTLADSATASAKVRTGGRVLPAFVALALLIGAGAVATTAAHTEPSEQARVLATLVVTGLALLISGVLGWILRPASRVGPLLCVAAIASLLPYLQDSDVDVVASTGYIARDLWLAVLIHIVVTYPDGRATPLARAIAALAYVRVLVPNLATALLVELPVPLQHRNFFNVGSEPAAVQHLRDVLLERWAGYVLGAAIAVLLLVRLATAGAVWRAGALPLLFAATLTILYTTFQNFSCATIIGWKNGGDAVAFAAIPLAILAALTGGRRARGRMGSLLIEIGGQPDAGALRHAVARALRDPSVEIAYRLGPSGHWVTPEGAPMRLPVDEPSRTISYLERDGEQVAAIVHDAAVASEPERLEPVRKAVRLLLDNERLTAEVRHQLDEVRASRRRIVEAGDEARRGVERNLHDGAQQRLVGLALNLRLAQRSADPTTALLLDEFAAELEAAIAELRELARGIHPSVVSESGLAPALAALAKRTPVSVTVEIDVPGRYLDTIEATVYYVVAEALTNIARYAEASGAWLTVFEAGDVLHVEVRDDGIGGAHVGAGSGLAGLRDRVDAIGGSLVIESPPGRGTRVIVQIALSGRMRPDKREVPQDVQATP